MQSEDEIDGIIDRGLATYSNAEPLSGIESRVLNRVRDVRARGRRQHSIGLVCAVMLGLMVAIVVAVPRFGHERTAVWRQQQRVDSEARVSVPSSPAAVAERRPKLRRPLRNARAGGGITTAPLSITQLSSDELALLTLVRTNPELAEVLVARQTAAENAEIVIEPIQITPLPETVSQ